MSVLERIAYLQSRKDEVPNQELVKELIETNNVDGIREIAENLFNSDKNIQSDCIKVLYEAVQEAARHYLKVIVHGKVTHDERKRPLVTN